MCRLRHFCINVDLGSASFPDFNILFSLIRSLRVSLTSPATLEILALFISITPILVDNFYQYSSSGEFRNTRFWSLLDSIITCPSGSLLQSVNIYITCRFDRLRHDRWDVRLKQDEISEQVLDGLPLLREKGILFVTTTVHGISVDEFN
jgi:hypothetical protein